MKEVLRLLLQEEIMAVTVMNEVNIEPKELFIPIDLTSCTEIILTHRHPAEEVTPYEDDIYFTKQVQEAGAIIGIPLHDLFIITATKYFSF